MFLRRFPSRLPGMPCRVRDYVRGPKKEKRDTPASPHFLTPEAARMLRLDQKPDGKHILWKLISTPGQYYVHYAVEEQEYFGGISSQHLATAFGTHMVDSGWLPSGVLRWGRLVEGEWMVRYYPPAHHSLQFGIPGQKDASTFSVPLPGMIFTGIGSTYYVWAVKEEPITPQVELYGAPLSNVWPDGRICYGTNRPPTISTENWSSVEDAWNLFIASPFMGDLSGGKSRLHAHDVRLQLAAVRDMSRYPLEDLLPYERGRDAATLEQAIALMLKATKNG